mgnify:CR=1 FL=1
MTLLWKKAITLAYREDETYSYADLKVGDDADLTEFKSFVKRLNAVPDGEKGGLESFLDVSSALKYIASNTVLCNYDSYNGNMHHNFYLYENADGIFSVIPWDFNMSFGGFGGANRNVGIDTPITSGSIDELPLIGKLLDVPEYKEEYYGYIKQLMNELEEDSAAKTGMTLNIAINYGGRPEIVRAAQQLAAKAVAGEIRPEDINEQMMSDAMYTAGQKDPDFILRPSGEKRLSNFMLWQAAYSELVEMDVLWPDFTRADLDTAIEEFNHRSRRFGGI